ncbi:hypothetical protein D6D19_02124 [Aureobasidium pullulans]|uniref:Uncharacterized protein n=2 Tax=Aureobasidium pullulans TaxID=5580 RepID=A0A074XW26_AURPU|nr:uncharacterized protein M438DRAFT_341400 [Aureobasidium pullulans EXF-150]THW39392.1 hypothetical protein D6D22_06305 [Aureobasidium pullulans]KEQ89670.1 hypothetical protein M438DRAFT_341400 [Aureobasidium pullulans EXF-150]THW77586.1 hypothetical protein D6D19_02124 [Aureobasidium pullulans]THW97047.1 hypothetical protein D6D15_00588 [Aureobasidium pullulans]THX23868.1 hypothetical protein D6D12_08070 [Aureobasidium pullulans]
MFTKTILATAFMALAASVAAAPTPVAQPDLASTLGNILSPGSGNANTGSLLSPGTGNSALNGNSAEGNGNGNEAGNGNSAGNGNTAGTNNGNGNTVDGNSLINLKN